MSIEEVRKLNQQGLGAWDAHKPDDFVATFADKFTFNDITLPKPITTKAALRQYVQGWFTAFPDMKISRTNVVVSTDAAAAEVEWDATHKGPIQGPPGTPAIPPTGKKVRGRGAYFAKVKNGKVTEFSAHPDVMGIMAQLGLMGQPAAAKK